MKINDQQAVRRGVEITTEGFLDYTQKGSEMDGTQPPKVTGKFNGGPSIIKRELDNSHNVS